MPPGLEDMAGSLRDGGRKSLVAYLTAGDPDLSFTREALLTLQDAGVDIIELGVPFSHPVGDGPVIQRSAARALSAGMALPGILQFVDELGRDGFDLPLVLFSYHNPVFSFGYGKLAAEAARVGVSGILVVDLPPEESRDYCQAFNSAGIATVFLATPTTSPERLQSVHGACSGFCYYVSRSGVTGGQEDLSDSLCAELSKVKACLPLPVYVGFGIRTAEQASRVAGLADGVIVGSAFVECIEKHPGQEALKKIKILASSLRSALDQH